MTQQRYLIVNADDFGYSDAVTDAILRAWRDGVVTSTSAMVTMDGASQRIASAHLSNPQLPIGLHLTITEGRPALPPAQVPTLVGKDGHFFSEKVIMQHLVNMSLDELQAELSAQAERLTAAGIQFDHIDYHHHMLALYTPFYALVRILARKYKVPVRQPIPASTTGKIKIPGKGGADVALAEMMRFALRHPILALRLMGSLAPAAIGKQSALLKEDGISSPDWFIDGYYDNASVDSFLAILHQLPPGISEIMVHPGPDAHGQIELEVLLDPKIQKAVANNGVLLTDFGFFRRNREQRAPHRQ